MMEASTYASKSFKTASLEHCRVVLALMLRDIKTRFGASYFGFLGGLAMPLGHIGILLGVYISLGRRAPIGTDVSFYLTTAILPFVLWSYTHQKLMQAFLQNRSLIYFPIVKYVDIILARGLIELLNSALIVAVVALMFMLFADDFFVSQFEIFFYILFLAYLLGIGTGMIFGLLAVLAPIFMILGFILVPLYWVTSGVFFIPDALPENLKIIVAIFPLSHIVDFGRTAAYASYMSNFASLAYVHIVILGSILTGLSMERGLRFMLSQ